MCEQAADLDEQEIKELVLSHYYKKNSQVGQDLEELLQSQYRKKQACCIMSQQAAAAAPVRDDWTEDDE
jgi:hypothetical protein